MVDDEFPHGYEEAILIGTGLAEGQVTLGLLYVMLEDIRQEVNAVRKDLARIKPLVEYAEQLIQQKERISKWLPGKKS